MLHTLVSAPGLGWALDEGTFTAESLTRVLLIGAVALLVCVVAVRFAARSGLPTLLLFLGVGVILGESGLGIRFDSPDLTQVLGYSALLLILAEGGLTTSWSGIKASVAPAAVLSTVGVVVSVGVVATAAHLLLGQPWDTALEIGAVLSSTDAAAVFSVLRTVPIPRRVRGMLEAESGFNDAPVVILVVSFAHLLAPGGEGSVSPWHLLLEGGFELGGGAVIGLAVGWGGAWLLRRVASASSGLFSIGVIGVSVLAYAGADMVGTSGFLAVYLCALLLGNLGLPHRAAVHSFATALGLLAQIGLFVLLGLLASPSRLPAQLLPALVLGGILLVLARPLAVMVSLTPFRTGWRDQVFLSWAGLRGAVPIVLATVPASMGSTSTGWIFDLVFVLVVVFTFVQAPTLPWVARRLGLTEAVSASEVAVESTPLEELGADLLTVRIGERSKLHGIEVFELRLPPKAQVTLVVRDTPDGKESFVPSHTSRLRVGDELLIVTPARLRDRAERQVRAISAHGRLARWTQSPRR